ncbi:MAG: sulfurtransferase TusA family protein [Pseudomonadales bacterium]
MSEQTPLEVNTRGLLCPMPVIRTQDAIKNLAAGAHLVVYATDPGTLHDIPAWCRVHGHTVLRQAEEGREFVFEIRVEA